MRTLDEAVKAASEDISFLVSSIRNYAAKLEDIVDFEHSINPLESLSRSQSPGLLLFKFQFNLVRFAWFYLFLLAVPIIHFFFLSIGSFVFLVFCLFGFFVLHYVVLQQEPPIQKVQVWAAGFAFVMAVLFFVSVFDPDTSFLLYVYFVLALLGTLVHAIHMTDMNAQWNAKFLAWLTVRFGPGIVRVLGERRLGGKKELQNPQSV